MRAFAYDRVSDPKQARNLNLETRYIETIGAYCERRGWKIDGVFFDAGISGKNAERPGLQKAIAAASADRGVLVFYDLTRFSRSMRDIVSIADTLKRNGAALASATEAIDTTNDNPSAELTLHVLGACAEFTRKLIGAKVREANRRRVQELGHRTQGTCPAGYKIVNGRRVENEREQEVLAQMQSLLAHGWDCSDVAAQLNALEVPTVRQLRGYRRAGTWTAAGVRRLRRAVSKTT